MRAIESDGDGVIQDFNYRVGNLNWYKCEHCHSEERENDCLCCREVQSISDEIFMVKKVLSTRKYFQLESVHLLKTPNYKIMDL